MSHAIVLVGCGNMGHAMLAGWLASGRLAVSDVTVVEPNESLRERAAALGVEALAEAPSTARKCLVILAVKPQAMAAVVPPYRPFSAAGSTFLSIAAGVGTAMIEAMLGGEAVVARCMPNTPAAIGKGMMVLFAGPGVTDDMRTLIGDLMASNGRVTTIEDESLMDAVTAVSGSGPAYVFHFIECLTEAARSAGLPNDVAKLLAMQTVYGAASLAAESSETPTRLREQVTSPNGTTAAALSVLMGGDRLKTLMGEAVEAARVRSVELGE